MSDAAAALYEYEPDEVLAPGETLTEVLEDLDMTQADLSKRTGLSAKHVNQMVNGAASITPETALKLEKATRVRARVWNTLEAAYREHLSRQEELKLMAKDIGWLEELPIAYLIKRGFLRRSSDKTNLVRQVCEFFGVADRATWEAVWQKPTAYRRSKAFASDPGAVAAWLRIGEVEASSIESSTFSRDSLVDLVSRTRAFTCDPEPKSWWPKLVERFALAGIVVVAVPEVPGARVNGAARWITPNKALVQLSLRHKWSDIFWFTFFHEIGHLLVHGKKDTFINDLGPHSGAEQEADAFASRALIPPKFEPQLADLQTTADVRSFAADIGIAPGIVVGRLQHDKRWPYNRGNDLKQRLIFVDN